MTEKYFSRLQMITIEFMKKQMKDIFITNIDPQIARTISSFMALIIIRGGFNIWPELL
jgi:anti-anti-sigma regulatory factor